MLRPSPALQGEGALRDRALRSVPDLERYVP